jgi:hypothetical protein
MDKELLDGDNIFVIHGFLPVDLDLDLDLDLVFELPGGLVVHASHQSVFFVLSDFN